MVHEYSMSMGRLRVEVSYEGAIQHDYGHGCIVSCVDGWNDSCPTLKHRLSVEELRNLRYLLDRAIFHADDILRRK